MNSKKDNKSEIVKFQSLPQIIDINNSFNEIYHIIEKSGNEALTKEIFLLCHKYISNPGRKE